MRQLAEVAVFLIGLGVAICLFVTINMLLTGSSHPGGLALLIAGTVCLIVGAVVLVKKTTMSRLLAALLCLLAIATLLVGICGSQLIH